MDDDMKAVVERVERDLVVLRLIEWTIIEGERRVGDMMTDLRTLLSALRQRDEALATERRLSDVTGRLIEAAIEEAEGWGRCSDGLTAAVEAYQIATGAHAEAADTILTGSETNAR